MVKLEQIDLDNIISAINNRSKTTHDHAGTYEVIDSSIARAGVSQTFTKPQRSNIRGVTYAANLVLDLSTSNNFSCTLAGNIVIANPSNIIPGQAGVIFLEVGSNIVSFGSYWKFEAGIVPTLSGNCMIAYIVKSSTEIIAVEINNVS